MGEANIIKEWCLNCSIISCFFCHSKWNHEYHWIVLVSANNPYSSGFELGVPVIKIQHQVLPIFMLKNGQSIHLRISSYVFKTNAISCFFKLVCSCSFCSKSVGQNTTEKHCSLITGSFGQPINSESKWVHIYLIDNETYGSM